MSRPPVPRPQERRDRAAADIVVDSDALYPRDEEHRYRLYALLGDDLTVIATAATAAGIGMAIVQVHEDQKEIGRRLADLGSIGVLDVLAGPRGDWVLLPWERGAGSPRA